MWFIPKNELIKENQAFLISYNSYQVRLYSCQIWAQAAHSVWEKKEKQNFFQRDGSVVSTTCVRALTTKWSMKITPYGWVSTHFVSAQSLFYCLSQRGSKAAPENLSIQTPPGTDFWVDPVFLTEHEHDGRTQSVTHFCHYSMTKSLEVAGGDRQ
jgi:hypothetical protein